KLGINQILRWGVGILGIDGLLSADRDLIPTRRRSFLRRRYQLVLALGIEWSHGDMQRLISFAAVWLKRDRAAGERYAVHSDLAFNGNELLDISSLAGSRA